MNDAAESRRAASDGSGNVFAAMAEALPEPVIVLDTGLRIVAANEKARTQFQALQPGNHLVRAIRAPDVVDAADRVAHDGEAENVFWHERVPHEQVFAVHVAPLDWDRRRHIVVTLNDLSEARRVERMRVDFIANASHELRTPLASLLGFIETLLGPARNDEAARGRFLVIMREQAGRMARLIDDLLSLSRIEQNQHIRPQTVVDLVPLVRHVVDTLAPMAKEEGALLQVAAPERALVTGDRDELIRVAENLIENAIKYGGRDGAAQVDVKIDAQPSSVTLAIADNGPGIAAEHLPRLTERFYRVDAPASRAKGGTGLGLAIVKHIVARHRGRLMVESRPGEGATFRVVLPVSEKDI